MKKILKLFNTDDKSISNVESVIHLINGTLGIAVLTIPIAVANAGLVCGTLWMVFAAGLTIHCIHNVVVVAQQISREKYKCLVVVCSLFCINKTDLSTQGHGVITIVIIIFICSVIL